MQKTNVCNVNVAMTMIILCQITFTKVVNNESLQYKMYNMKL